MTGRAGEIEQAVDAAMTAHFNDIDPRGPAPRKIFEMVMEAAEPAVIRATLRYTAGNQSRAAAVLGLNRATLRTKILHYRINPEDFMDAGTKA